MLSGMESHDQDPTTPQPGGDAGDASDPSERPTEPSSAAGPPAGDPPPATPDGGAAEGPRRLYRSRDERVVGGVCGGLAEYFGIDPLIVRIITVGLVFAGGAGFLAYLAAWLLVPEADGASVADGNGRLATIAGTVLLVLAIGTVLPFGTARSAAGHGAAPSCRSSASAWRGSPSGGWLPVSIPPRRARATSCARAGFGVALLAVCGLLALGGAWATAAGGGVIVAAVVIVRGPLARRGAPSSAARAG